MEYIDEIPICFDENNFHDLFHAIMKTIVPRKFMISIFFDGNSSFSFEFVSTFNEFHSLCGDAFRVVGFLRVAQLSAIGSDSYTPLDLNVDLR